MKIITLCTGNICRSPMAEGLLRALLKQAKLTHIQTDSAGTHDYHPRHKPDSRAISVMRKHGYDISDLRARVLTTADTLPADSIIMAATNAHRRHAEQLKAQINGQAQIIKLLDHHPDTSKQGQDLADPYYGDERDFEDTYQSLIAALTSFVNTLNKRP
ncbi:Probable low molecular weight protein-tyrosine-phosphatase [Suttonella ornithocola]|uniref:protein-tyrosine-phosphatase n=2 Tax=Suttonella ornithocola TaxID=279832 RepID=A0A380MN72_9GAMM|nr:Probable low molecular weight protein-tyrosine-phosphatase [Suttonella ornithocola]